MYKVEDDIILDQEGNSFAITLSGGMEGVPTPDRGVLHTARAELIAAALNACEGIDLESLKELKFSRLLESDVNSVRNSP